MEAVQEEACSKVLCRLSLDFFCFCNLFKGQVDIQETVVFLDLTKAFDKVHITKEARTARFGSVFATLAEKLPPPRVLPSKLDLNTDIFTLSNEVLLQMYRLQLLSGTLTVFTHPPLRQDEGPAA